MTDPAIAASWRYGFGTGTCNLWDYDMVEAAILSRTDQNGNSLWSPTSADLENISHRTLMLFVSMQNGMFARAQPYRWLCPAGGYAHQVRVAPEDTTENVTRCGKPVDNDWSAADDLAPRCRVCLAEDNGTRGMRITRTE